MSSSIGTGNIKLLKSQVQLDTPDGGGAMTANEIVDGVSNNLFPDISELDRAYGRIALRKFFESIQTTDTDSYFGSTLIVSKKPADPRVSVCLFTTKSWTDRRVQAKDNVERYLAQGPKWAGHVLEMQLTGQRVIQQCVRSTDAEPKVGQGLVLTYHEGLTDAREQFVRVTKITSELRTFTVGSRDVERKVLTIELSDPLRYDFPGLTVSDFEQGIGLETHAALRDTRVADAASYYGISTMTADANISDAVLDVDSIYTQLVPSSQSETPLIDLNAAGLRNVLAPSSSAPVVVGYPYGASAGAANTRFFVGSSILPGSISLVSGHGETITDVGGVLKSGALNVGTVEYDKGLFIFNANSTIPPSYAATLTFKPAAVPQSSPQTASIHITQSSRGYNFTMTIRPIPGPTSLVVSYVALGKVYYLYEDGTGSLKGSDSAFGSGTLSFITGTALITLGALPDADSDILFSWGSPATTFVRDTITVAPAKLLFQLDNQQVTPGTISAHWTLLGVAKTATDNGIGGFTGDAVGRINYSSGKVELTPVLLPQTGTVFSFDYQHGPPNTTSFVAPARTTDGYVNVTLPDVGGAVVPGSVQLSFSVDAASYYDSIFTTQRVSPPLASYGRLFNVQFFDKQLVSGDALGVWRYPGAPGVIIYPGNIATQPGSITYASRLINFNPEVVVGVPVPNFLTVGFTAPENLGIFGYRQVANAWVVDGFTNVTSIAKMPSSGTVTVTWRTDASDSAVSDETHTLDQITYDLTPGFAETIIPGSVLFVLGGRVYIDRASTLYHTASTVTGSGTVGGDISYEVGTVNIRDWMPGASNAITLKAMATTIALSATSGAVFRVPIIPVRPGSIQIRAVPVDGGTEFTATMDNTGHVTTSNVIATADFSSGVVTLNFGAEVEITTSNRAAIEASPWYVAELEYTRSGHTYIFHPKPVYGDSIRYNAVSYTYLPLSSDVLGLDPVRLPSDGRVPIFKPGVVGVVHNTQKNAFSSPAIGSSLDVGRVRCAYIKVIDTAGHYVPESQYTANPDDGTVVLGSSFTTAGLTLPLYAEHRVEDMSLITDVQINGRITLSRPLTHAYPSGTSFVSSALIVGDLQARAYNLFSQSAWTGVWSDVLIGSAPVAQYNDVNYPLIVTNQAAIEEQWAVIFVTNTTFNVIGKSVGQIVTGASKTALLAPTNPVFGQPYFQIDPLGWGTWSAGNVLRFNTAAANYPAWCARTVLQGPATEVSDSFQLQVRGDVDN